MNENSSSLSVAFVLLLTILSPSSFLIIRHTTDFPISPSLRLLLCLLALLVPSGYMSQGNIFIVCFSFFYPSFLFAGLQNPTRVITASLLVSKPHNPPPVPTRLLVSRSSSSFVVLVKRNMGGRSCLSCQWHAEAFKQRRGECIDKRRRRGWENPVCVCYVVTTIASLSHPFHLSPSPYSLCVHPALKHPVYDMSGNQQSSNQSFQPVLYQITRFSLPFFHPDFCQESTSPIPVNEDLVKGKERELMPRIHCMNS